MQGDIFMEQKMWFGLILGWLAILKKKFGSIMSNFCGWFFQVFRCNFFENVAASALKSCIISIWEKINKRKMLPPKTWQNRPQIGLNSQSIVYWLRCSWGKILVFCYHNCSNVLWEKIVLVWGKKLRKKFENSRP